MSEGTAVAAPAAAPTNGANGAQTPIPGGPGRDATGKFTKGEPAPAAPQNDDPEFDLGDGRKLKRSHLLSELGRARSSSKLLTEAQKEKAEAIRLRQEFESERETLKKDPRAAIIKQMRAAGFDDNQIREHLSTTLYAEYIEPEQLTAEQRRIRDLEAKLSEKQQREEAEAAKQRTVEEARATDEAAAQLEAEFDEAMKAGKVPPTKAAIRRIASVIRKYEDRNQSISIDQAVSIVRDEAGRETGEFAASASIDELRDLWGDAAWKAHVKKVMDWGLSQARPGAMATTQRPQPRPLMQQDSKKRITPQEFDALMRKVK